MFSVIFPGQGSQTIGMGREFFERYNLVKDLRTNVETGNTVAVLDGELDQFINEALAKNL